ncbi:conserved exported hypothetical protein [Bradyrhizobium sp. ORS 375]|nr:conserved exported hypothetical protein [Bradyrhizobium sp. ORS 375]
MSRRRRVLKPVPVFILAATLGGCLASAESISGHSGDAPVSGPRVGGSARPATYDPEVWYESDFWGREWPDGFTIDKDMTLAIRTKPEIGAPKSASCALRAGAAYHPWNTKRVKADRLSFVTFTRIRTYELTRDLSTELSKSPSNESVKVKFKAGDRWSAVGPGAEGFFLMRVGTDVYQAYQDMFDASAEIGGRPAKDTSPEDDEHEWLQLRCANGAAGWIFYNEIKDAPGLSLPDQCGEGCAEDRKPARRRSPPSASTR